MSSSFCLRMDHFLPFSPRPIADFACSTHIDRASRRNIPGGRRVPAAGIKTTQNQSHPWRERTGAWKNRISLSASSRWCYHLGGAYNLAHWLIRNEHDAEDVVQEACLRALNFDGFRGGDPRAWLLTIVRNCCYTWLKQNSKTVGRSSPPLW